MKEYLEWFPGPDNHEGTAKSGLLAVPAVVTLKEGGAPVLRVAMPALLGHGLLEIRFTEAKWDGASFTATTPPGGFFGGTVTMEGVMSGTCPEAKAIRFSDLAMDLGGVTATPWTFKTKAALEAGRRTGSAGK